jgi:hypothetical protein
LKEKLDEIFKVGVSSPKIPNISFKTVVSKLYMDEIESFRGSCERIREIRDQYGHLIRVLETRVG